MAHERHAEDHDEMISIEVQRYLDGVRYPTDKQTLVGFALQRGADDSVLAVLQQLPDREYRDPTEVSERIWEQKEL
jgi:hypothetical protein